MSARPRPVLIKPSGMLQNKIPSTGLRFKHENTDSTKITNAPKFLWIVLSPICDMHIHEERKFIDFINGLNPTTHIFWLYDSM